MAHSEGGALVTRPSEATLLRSVTGQALQPYRKPLSVTGTGNPHGTAPAGLIRQDAAVVVFFFYLHFNYIHYHMILPIHLKFDPKGSLRSTVDWDCICDRQVTGCVMLLLDL